MSLMVCWRGLSRCSDGDALLALAYTAARIRLASRVNRQAAGECSWAKWRPAALFLPERTVTVAQPDDVDWQWLCDNHVMLGLAEPPASSMRLEALDRSGSRPADEACLDALVLATAAHVARVSGVDWARAYVEFMPDRVPAPVRDMLPASPFTGGDSVYAALFGPQVAYAIADRCRCGAWRDTNATAPDGSTVVIPDIAWDEVDARYGDDETHLDGDWI